MSPDKQIIYPIPTSSEISDKFSWAVTPNIVARVEADIQKTEVANTFGGSLEARTYTGDVTITPFPGTEIDVLYVYYHPDRESYYTKTRFPSQSEPFKVSLVLPGDRITLSSPYGREVLNIEKSRSNPSAFETSLPPKSPDPYYVFPGGDIQYDNRNQFPVTNSIAEPVPPQVHVPLRMIRYRP